MIIANRCLFLVLAAMVMFFNSGTAHAQDSLDSILKPYLLRYDLPAIAAAVVKDGKIISAGAVCTRRIGGNIPVTVVTE